MKFLTLEWYQLSSQINQYKFVSLILCHEIQTKLDKIWQQIFPKKDKLLIVKTAAVSFLIHNEDVRGRKLIVNDDYLKVTL